MGFLIQYVDTAAPYIYAVCGLIALLQVYRVWQVRIERRQAVFTLEREKALGDLYRIFVSAMTILLVMGLTYFVSTTLSRAVEPIVVNTLEPTPLAILIPTPTHTPLPATETPTVTPTSVATVVVALVAEEVPTATPPPPTPEPAPAVEPAFCPDGRSVIVSPGNGAVVRGTVSIVGTAQHDDFRFYKLEIAPGNASSGGYSYFDGAERQVTGGLVGVLNSRALANGTYTIQLVVVDSTGNYPQPCRVTIRIEN